MKASTTETRLAISEWLSDFDTRVVEFPYGVRAILAALSVVTTYNGHSAAPFLDEALGFLDNSSTVWWMVLLVTGIFQIIAVAIGTRRKTYLLRMIASFMAAFVWFAVLLAMLSTPQPLILGGQYFMAMLTNLFAGLVLWTQHDDATAQVASELDVERSRADAAIAN